MTGVRWLMDNPRAGYEVEGGDGGDVDESMGTGQELGGMGGWDWTMALPGSPTRWLPSFCLRHNLLLNLGLLGTEIALKPAYVKSIDCVCASLAVFKFLEL